MDKDRRDEIHETHLEFMRPWKEKRYFRGI